MTEFRLKRVYEPPDPSDGVRVLVDRLWPRGLSKERVRADRWLREVAPSDDLRRWFAHEPEKWQAFRQRYRDELERKPEAVAELAALAEDASTVTLLFAAKDERHNQAVVLREFLLQQKLP